MKTWSSELTEAGVLGLDDCLLPSECDGLSDPRPTTTRTLTPPSRPDLLAELKKVQALDEMIVEENQKIQRFRQEEHRSPEEVEPPDPNAMAGSSDEEPFLVKLEEKKREVERLERSLEQEQTLRKRRGTKKVVRCSIMVKARSESREDEALCNQLLRTRSPSQDPTDLLDVGGEPDGAKEASTAEPHDPSVQCEDGPSTSEETSPLKKAPPDNADQSQPPRRFDDEDGTVSKPEASLTPEMKPDDGAFDPGGHRHLLPPVPKPRKVSLPVGNLAEEDGTSCPTNTGPLQSSDNSVPHSGAPHAGAPQSIDTAAPESSDSGPPWPSYTEAPQPSDTAAPQLLDTEALHPLDTEAPEPSDAVATQSLDGGALQPLSAESQPSDAGAPEPSDAGAPRFTDGGASWSTNSQGPTESLTPEDPASLEQSDSSVDQNLVLDADVKNLNNNNNHHRPPQEEVDLPLVNGSLSVPSGDVEGDSVVAPLCKQAHLLPAEHNQTLPPAEQSVPGPEPLEPDCSWRGERSEDSTDGPQTLLDVVKMSGSKSPSGLGQLNVDVREVQWSWDAFNQSNFINNTFHTNENNKELEDVTEFQPPASSPKRLLH